MTDEELKAYIANATKKSQETGIPIMRKDTVLAPAYKPEEESSLLPTAGAVIGGIAGATLIKNPWAGATAGRALVGSMIPSLVGSSAGTAAGTAAERAIQGDLFSQEGAKQMMGNLVENAAWDVGGNLVFSLGGKAYRVGKEAISKYRGGGFLSDEENARRAAQAWLSERGATLTKGQLTGDVGTQAVEGTLKYTTGAPSFMQQEQGVAKALKQGSQEVMDSLATSDAFQMALKQGDPTQMAVGDRFQTAIKAAEGAMKDKYRPIYQQLEKEGDGLFINMKPIKDMAKQELDKLAKRKFAGAGAERRRALEDIINQADSIPLSTAHELRSDFLAGAREASKEGVPATALQAEYNKQAAAIQGQMDSVMVATFGNTEEKALARKLGMFGGIDQPAGLRTGQYLGSAKDLDTFLNMVGKTKATTANNQLLRDYFNAQKSYGDAMKGFYSGTVSAALKSEPSAVGGYLFNSDRPERMREAYAAIAQAKKYLKPEDSKGLTEELMYGYLSKALESPEALQSLSKNLDNKTFRESFNYLFREPTQRKLITDLANAANYGTETFKGSSALRTRGITAAVGAAETAAAGSLAYLVMPDAVKDKLDFSSTALSAGLLYITPRLVSKAMTSKEGMDALAGLIKAQNNPKYAGAVGAKLASQLEKSGIIDSDYIKSVNDAFNAPRQQQQQPQPSSLSDTDLLNYIQQQQGQ